eukprot:TRINITY_DN54112_c0_g1_i1.p1 TRINITY_DN54112_c0_g1~~TRINITY_DN54112_c0_g1_i1.p1  ORF type:complete len:336 (-),score=83.60 TRINITY_DN54112_c0_g1_i1:64-1071(-)
MPFGLQCAALASAALVLAASSLEPRDCFVGEDQLAHRDFCCCGWVRTRSLATRKVIQLRCWQADRTWEACCLEDECADANEQGFFAWGTADYWETRYQSGGWSSEAGVTSRSTDGAPSASQSEEVPELYHVRTEALARILESLPLQPPSSTDGRGLRLLDLGVGDGRQAYMLLERFPSVSHYIGLDLSPSVVERTSSSFAELLHASADASAAASGVSRTAPAVAEFYAYDGFELPVQVASRSFDVALSLQVLMHILEEELFDAYMSLLCAPTHKFIIVHAADAEIEQENHIRGWRFRERVLDAGFRQLLHLDLADLMPRELHDHAGDALWVFERI